MSAIVTPENNNTPNSANNVLPIHIPISKPKGNFNIKYFLFVNLESIENFCFFFEIPYKNLFLFFKNFTKKILCKRKFFF